MKEFRSIDAFLSYMSRVPAELEKARHLGLEEAGKGLVAGAQMMIGHEILEWPPLAHATLYGGVSPEGHWFPGKIELGYVGHISETDPLLRTGELRLSIAYRVEGYGVTLGSTDPIAPFQEYGTSRMSPRPFIGATMFRDGRAAAHLIAAYELSVFGLPIPRRQSNGTLTGG